MYSKILRFSVHTKAGITECPMLGQKSSKLK